MVAKIVIEEGDLKGLSLNLEEGDAWTIGRDPEICQFVVDDPSVSSKHLIINQKPEGFFVKNVSENISALLNEEELKNQEAPLQNGDRLQIGNEILFFYEDTSARVIEDDPLLSEEFPEDEEVPEEVSAESQEESLEKQEESPASEGILEKENSPEEPLPEEKELSENESSEIESSESKELNEELLDENSPEIDELLNELPLEKGEENLPEPELENLSEEIESNELDETINAENDENAIAPEMENQSEGEASPEDRADHPQEETSIPSPISTPPPPPSNADLGPRQDTIFFGEGEDDVSLANIDFGVIETGRWLLKVIGGPNNGAEFYMQAGNSYVLGTDPHNCDIVFHDNSVSRQHAKITVSPEDTLIIEDLKSRNGVLINGAAIEGHKDLLSNAIVTLGTTSFAVYDREGEMHTIISPLLPSIAKVLLGDGEKKENAEDFVPVEGAEAQAVKEETALPEIVPEVVEQPQPPKSHFGPYMALTAIIGLFVIAGIGTTTLFRDEPVVMQQNENADALILQTVKPFPAVRWTFNKSNGGLLLLGHTSTLDEKNQLIYNLSMLKFIKYIDDSGIIIDEGVWKEVNSLLANNPEWKGINIHSPAAGQFVLSGELQTRKQADRLTSYLGLNFPYLDLLKSQIVIDEDVINQVQLWLQEGKISDVKTTISNGAVQLSGSIQPEREKELVDIIDKIKQIQGVRIVNNNVEAKTVETGINNLTGHYSITGKSRIGNKYKVIIQGRILSEGDDLDGMTITQISPNQVNLEKGKDRFRIDY